MSTVEVLSWWLSIFEGHASVHVPHTENSVLIVEETILLSSFSKTHDTMEVISFSCVQHGLDEVEVLIQEDVLNRDDIAVSVYLVVLDFHFEDISISVDVDEAAQLCGSFFNGFSINNVCWDFEGLSVHGWEFVESPLNVQDVRVND